MNTLVKQARERANLSQRALAKMVGVSGGAIAKYENGTRVLGLDALHSISKATGVKMLWFLEEAGYLPKGGEAPREVTPHEALRVIARLVDAATDPNPQERLSQQQPPPDPAPPSRSKGPKKNLAAQKMGAARNKREGKARETG